AGPRRGNLPLRVLADVAAAAGRISRRPAGRHTECSLRLVGHLRSEPALARRRDAFSSRYAPSRLHAILSRSGLWAKHAVGWFDPGHHGAPVHIRRLAGSADGGAPISA